MITFTDKRLYVKGICSAQLQDPSTGEILSQSDKFASGNINFSANTDPCGLVWATALPPSLPATVIRR